MDDITGYDFAEFRIDLSERILLQRGEQVAIRPKIFDLLLLLIEKRGEVVSKEIIINRIWPDEFVEDGNLTQSIYYLRRIIDDPGQNTSHILTVPTRGYLFTAEVDLVTDQKTDSSLSRDGLEEPEVEPSPAYDLTVILADSGMIRRPRRKILLTGAIIFLIVCCLTGLGVYLVSVSSIRHLTILSISSIPGLQLDPEFSPDGKFLAFSGYDEAGRNEDIYLKKVDQDQVIRITTNTDAERSPVFSPDGRSIAFLRWTDKNRQRAKIILTDPEGGGEKEVGESCGALAWMPDSAHLIINDSESLAMDLSKESLVLYQISLDGRERRQLTFSSKTKFIDTMPRLSANGKHLAFLRSLGSHDQDIHILEIPSGNITQVTSDHRLISSFRWGVRGAGFYFVSDRSGQSRLWFIAVIGMSREIFQKSGIPRLTEQIPYELDQFVISPDGRLLAYSKNQKGSQTQIIDLVSGGEKVRELGCIVASTRTYDSPQFSPDGRKVAFVSHRSGSAEIWLANFDCSQPVQLTKLGGESIGALRWSPGGVNLVFERIVDGQFEIYTIRLDGGGLQRLTNNEYDDLGPSWSRDGRSIYFESMSTPQGRINRIPATGGEVVPIVSAGGSRPVESVDGTKLYFTRAGTLWSKDLRATEDGRARESIVEPLRNLRVDNYWHLASGAVYFISDNTGSMMAVDRLDFSSGKIRRVTEINGSRYKDSGSLNVSSDERYIIVTFSYGGTNNLSIVEGWRIHPLSQYLIKKLYLENILFPKS